MSTCVVCGIIKAHVILIYTIYIIIIFRLLVTKYIKHVHKFSCSLNIIYI